MPKGLKKRGLAPRGRELHPDELEEQALSALPKREVLSIVDVSGSGTPAAGSGVALDPTASTAPVPPPGNDTVEVPIGYPDPDQVGAAKGDEAIVVDETDGPAPDS